MNENVTARTEDGRSITSAVPPFRALDPELPGLAARAAFQLDNLRLQAEGKLESESTKDAIEKFAVRLQGALAMPTPLADRKALLDPLTTSILHGAIVQVMRDRPTSLDEVLSEIGRVTEQLLKVEGFPRNMETITALRNFCLVISDLATSKQHLMRAPRPYHGPKTARL